MKAIGQLPSIDPKLLTEVVQRAIGQEIDEIFDWGIDPLSGGWEATTSIYHLTGSARERDVTVDWQLVLKIVRSTPERTDHTHWNYWAREPLAYRSGILSDLPDGIVAPRCYGVVNRPDNSIWIWLEALTDTTGAFWALRDYGVASRQLGRFNGAYLTSWPLPRGEWVSRGWLRSYVTNYAPIIEKLPDLQTHPLVRRAVPPQFVDELLRLSAERETFLDTLDQLPQSFCHLDSWRWNLFITAGRQGQPQVVAVDWAFVGIGAIGQELAPLVFSNRSDPKTEGYALRYYLAGLSDAGWRGEAETVSLGYAITMALEYGLALIGFYVEALLDEQQYASLEQGFGEPIDKLIEQYASWLAFALPRAEQARHLLGQF